jgi:ParB family transcriptional regulator, chromosome partitioning protein
MGDPRAAPELQELALEEIEPNFSQPRYHFDEAALEALAGSLREHGVLQPVLVRPRPEGGYELVAGERRWRAAEIAGLDRIPALVCSYDDAAAFEVALIENVSREDLNIVEEIRAFATLRELGLTHREIGERVGRSTSAVANIVRMLDLSDEILGFLERGELRLGHGLELLAAKDPDVRGELARRAVKEGWTVMATAARARESNMSEPKPMGGPEEVGLEGERERERDAGQGQEPDLTVMNVARVWGDLLGVEVGVRTLSSGQFRVEAVFTSPETALAVGGHLTELVARAKKRR